MNSLTAKFTWPEIIDKSWEKVKAFIPPKQEQEFRTWMTGKERVGICFDALMIGRAFQVYKRLQQSQDYVIVVVGKEGSGKSTFGCGLASWISDTFSIGHVHFDSSGFIRGIKNSQPGDAQVADEAGTFLFSREAMTVGNRAVIKLLMTTRVKAQCIILCVPDFGSLDSYLRIHRLNLLVQITELGHFKAMFGPALTKINQDFSKTRSLSAIRLPADYFWHGYFNNTMGNVNMADYKRKKLEYVDDLLDVMAGAADKELKSLPQILPARVVAARMGITTQSLWKMINKGLVEGRKIGSRWYVSADVLAIKGQSGEDKQ